MRKRKKKHHLDPARKLKRNECYVFPEMLRDLMNRRKARQANHRFSFWNETIIVDHDSNKQQHNKRTEGQKQTRDSKEGQVSTG